MQYRNIYQSNFILFSFQKIFAVTKIYIVRGKPYGPCRVYIQWLLAPEVGGLRVWSMNKNQIYSADEKRAHIQQRGARENNHTKPKLRNIRYLLIVFVIFFRFISSWQRRLSWKHVRFSFILLESLLVSRFARESCFAWESHFAWVSRFARVSCYARMTRFARCVLWLTFCD